MYFTSKCSNYINNKSIMLPFLYGICFVLVEVFTNTYVLPSHEFVDILGKLEY